MEKTIFNIFRNIVYEKSGISLNDGKEDLVSSRICKRMNAIGITDFRDYLKYLKDYENNDEIIHMINAISTNVTSFFRETEHFDFLSQTVKEWINQGQNEFRFWSAACSSGEEPYSIAMTAADVLYNRSASVRILATDISTSILDKARSGIYTEDNVKAIPRNKLQKFFDSYQTTNTVKYEVKRSLKDRIFFCRLNLSKTPYPMRGPFDIIFCRNVMIYFDNIVRKKLVVEMSRLTRPGGYLITGHSESLAGISDEYLIIKPSIYKKKNI